MHDIRQILPTQDKITMAIQIDSQISASYQQPSLPYLSYKATVEYVPQRTVSTSKNWQAFSNSNPLELAKDIDPPRFNSSFLHQVWAEELLFQLFCMQVVY